MSLVRVIGVGSPFQDDRVGFNVIQLLQHSERLPLNESTKIQLHYADRPGVRLLELMQGAETVILIDAVKSDKTIGALYCVTAEQLAESDVPYSSHALGVAEVLKMGKVLELLPPHILIYGISIGETAIDFELSQVMQQLLQQLVELIEQKVNSVLSENNES